MLTARMVHVFVLTIHRVLKQRQKEAKSDTVDMSDVMDGLQRKARDHGRTPMQASGLKLSLRKLIK